MIMISMPMNYDNWRIDYLHKKEELEQQGYQVAPLYASSIYEKQPKFAYEVKNINCVYISNSFARMAIADTIYFCKGWEKARGCRLEHQAALDYNLKIMYEE